MAFFGFNNKKHSSIGGDFDRDGVRNRRDCQPMNWRKQDSAETKARLQKLKAEIESIQINYKDYPEDLDEALSEVSSRI